MKLNPLQLLAVLIFIVVQKIKVRCQTDTDLTVGYLNVAGKNLTFPLKVAIISDVICDGAVNPPCPSNASIYYGPGSRSAYTVLLLQNTINHTPALWPFHNMTISVLNTRGFSRESVKETMLSANDMRTIAIFGLEKSCSIEALIAGTKNKLLLSHFCSTSTLYPTFVQFQGQFMATANAVVKFILMHEWDRVVTVYLHYYMNTEMPELSDRLHTMLLENNIKIIKRHTIQAGLSNTVNYNILMPQLKGTLPFAKILRESFLSTRVYILISGVTNAASTTATVWFSDVMGRMGLLQTGEYTLITLFPKLFTDYYDGSSATSDVFFTLSSPSPLRTPYREEMFDNFRSVAIFTEAVVTDPLSWPRFQSDLSNVTNQYKQKPLPCPPFCNFPRFETNTVVPTYAAKLYESILLYVQKVTDLIVENKTDITDGFALKQYFYGLKTPDGSPIPVTLDGYAQARENVTVSTATFGPDGRQGVFPVGYFVMSSNGGTNTFTQTQKFNWVNGQPPPPGPKCGFDREKCPTPIKQRTKWWLIAVFLVIIAVILTAGGYIYYKRHQRYIRMVESAWKIELKDLVIWQVGPQWESHDSLGSDDDLSEKSGSTSQMHRSSKNLQKLVKPDIEDGADDDIEAAAAPVGTIAEAAAKSAANAAKSRAAARIAQLLAMDTIEEAPLEDDFSYGPSTSRSTAVISKNPDVKRPSVTNKTEIKRPSISTHSEVKRPSISNNSDTKRLSFDNNPDFIIKRPSIATNSENRLSISENPETKRPSRENIEFTEEVQREAKKKLREERRKRKEEGRKIRLASEGVILKRKTFSTLEDWKGVATYTTALYQGRMVGLKRVFRTTVEPLTKKMKWDIYRYSRIKSNSVARLLGIVFESDQVFMMVEYCHKGNLHEMLLNPEIKLERMFISAIVFDILSGLQYLKHADRIGAHGRLSSSNCLITSTWNVKLTGFGLWSFLDTETRDDLTHEEFCTKKLYTPPELIRMNFDSAPGFWRADVYAFGIVLHEIYSREGPWASYYTSAEIIERVKTPRIHEPLCRPRFDKVIKAPQFMCDIMAECWAENAYMRPRYGELWEKLQPLREGLSYNLLDNIVELMKRYNNNLEEVIEERVHQEEIELEKCEALLASMLPKKVSDVLKMGLPVEPEKFEDITLYFSDVVGYSNFYSLYNVYQVINFLDAMFKHMDALIKAYDVYKVETINDSYMAVSGLPKRNKELHSGEIASMALHIMRDVKNHKIKQPNGEIVQMRMGIHSGLVMAGVVGLKMPRYCLFGDTVNTTSRFESTSLAFKIHCSAECRQRLLKLGGYDIVERGIVFMKGKGEKLTYWLVGEDASVREERMKENAEWLKARPDV